MIVSQSVVLSKIPQELKNGYLSGTEESKIKRLQRFLTNKVINPESIYEFFSYKLLQDYKNHSNKVYIIFDYTTVYVNLKVGKRAIPLWYKMSLYKEKGNKDFKHVKEGLKFIHEILATYNFEVIILADRGFKSVDLLEFIVYLEQELSGLRDAITHLQVIII